MANLLPEALQALRAENTELHVGVTTPAQSAAGATVEHVFYTDAIFSGEDVGGSVLRVVFVPEATVTGVNTNTATLTVEQYDNTGAHVNTIATLAFVTGKNAAAFAQTDLTINNADLGPQATLTYKLVQGGSGLAVPAGRIVAQVSASSR